MWLANSVPAVMREILHASPAAEPGRAFQAAAVVGINAAAVRANRLAVGIGPTDAAEGHFGVGVFHREDLSQREGLGGLGKEEVLGHLDNLSFMISYHM